MSRRREYYSWLYAKGRCFSPRDKRFKDYGGRGITMCSEWRQSFVAFYQHLGPCPQGKTLGRVNNDGPYAPGNCRWETREEQQNNMRTNRRLLFNGESLSVSQWARKLNLNKGTLQRRLQYGWPLERALSIKPQIKGYQKVGRLV